MNRFYKIFSIFTLLLLSSTVYGQIPISDEGTITVDCDGGPLILTDSNADGGNYAAGESYTITFCPDGGNAVFFLIDAETEGDIWDVLAGDNISVYDGDDASAPLLGSFSSSTAGPVIYYAATIENPTGCLTIVFNSSASSDGGAGWTSQINCGNQWQPFEIELTTAESTLDEGNYIDICQGEEVMFTANGIFPYADGSGYNQTNDNCYWEWDLGDGTELEGFGLTEVSNTYFEEYFIVNKIHSMNPDELFFPILQFPKQWE